jgi:hypothetical protein
MRAIIAAVALILAFGAGMPEQAEGRVVGAKKTRWGCTFYAGLVGFEGFHEGSRPEPFPAIVSYGFIRCDRQRTFEVRTKLVKRVPGASDQILGREDLRLKLWKVANGRYRTEIGYGPYLCPVPDAAAGSEVYLRVKLWRKLHPRDKLHLRTRPSSVVPEECDSGYG